MIYAFIFGVNFGYIFLRAFQQQNVIHGKWLWVIPCSYIMGYCEVYIVDAITSGASLPLLAFWIGTGGWLGCVASMWLHRRLR